jgi:hypothetical protein
MVRRILLGGGLALLLAAFPAAAFAATLKDFFGAFVGVATVEDLRTGDVRHRDMDIVIEPFHEDGFRIRWVNVSLVDGRRDLPGVERRVQTAQFQPAGHANFFVEVQEGSLFRERETMRPVAGDPVRWAALLDDTLRVTTFQVLEDGRYEMQIYDRKLTDIGIDVRFERIMDDVVVRRIVGNTARANMGSGEE